MFTYCEKNNIPNPFVKEKRIAGRAWVEGFLHRYPMIASHKAQNLNPGIAQNFNRFIVNDFFAKLKMTMEELGVMNKPECIYIVDEKGRRLCLDKQSLVMIQKRQKTLTWLLLKMGKMSRSCPAEMLLDHP